MNSFIQYLEKLLTSFLFINENIRSFVPLRRIKNDISEECFSFPHGFMWSVTVVPNQFKKGTS
jgi:hypothetical protein